MKRRIRKIYNKMSIRTKWSIFVVILIIYPMILLGYVGYKNYENMITEHFVKSVQEEVFTVSELVQEKLEEIEAFISKIQYDQNIYQFTYDYYKIIKDSAIDLEAIKQDEREQIRLKQTVMADYNLKKDIESYLQSIILSRQDISLGAFQFVGQDDIGYIVNKEQGSAYYEQTKFMHNKIFEKIENSFVEDTNTTYYIDDNNEIYIGKKIFYREDFTHCANVIFKINHTDVLKRYQRILGDSKEAIYIVTKNDKELMALGSLSREREEKVKSFINSNYQTGSLYKEESKKEAVVYNAFESQNLSIVSAVFISLDILLQDIRKLSGLIFMLCMSMIPIFLLLANKLYKEVIYPIYILSNKMHQIEKGEWGTYINHTRNDEIGYVYGAFNKMSKEMAYLVNCVYKEQIALKQAELKALQAQINPHFLYNTLEMINWKARMIGEDDISEMIEALGGIMEINIDRRENPFLTIEEELKYIKNYIFLIQKRFGDRINFHDKIQEEVLRYKIPRLLLQPLIENAIEHGIEPIGRGVIEIEVSKIQDNLCIVIKDNGKGMEKEQLEELTRQIIQIDKKYIEDKESDKGHIGVINVQRRTQLLYGNEYGMSIQSEIDKGTQVTLILPATMTGEKEKM